MIDVEYSYYAVFMLFVDYLQNLASHMPLIRPIQIRSCVQNIYFLCHLSYTVFSKENLFVKMASQNKLRGFREKYRGKGDGLNPQLPQKLYKFSKENVANPPKSHKQKKKKIGQQPSGDEVWKKVYIFHGSIVDEDLIEDEVDAIVNPANERLWTHGSGVCDVIFRAAGHDKLAKACNVITDKTDDNRIPTGQTVATKPFALNKLQYILHTIAPCLLYIVL